MPLKTEWKGIWCYPKVEKKGFKCPICVELIFLPSSHKTMPNFIKVLICIFYITTKYSIYIYKSITCQSVCLLDLGLNSFLNAISTLSICTWFLKNQVHQTWSLEKVSNSIFQKSRTDGLSITSYLSVLDFWNLYFTKLIFELDFFVYFKLDFYCMCSLQKSSSK